MWNHLDGCGVQGGEVGAVDDDRVNPGTLVHRSLHHSVADVIHGREEHADCWRQDNVLCPTLLGVRLDINGYTTQIVRSNAKRA